MGRSENDKRRTAYHECGHALVGHHFDLVFAGLALDPTEGLYGHCQFKPGQKLEPWPYVLTLMAGKAAGKMAPVDPPGDRDEPEEDDEDDVHEKEASLDEWAAVNILERHLGYKGADALVEQLGRAEKEARNILDAWRPEFEALVQALLERLRLSPEEIIEIIETA